MEHVIAVAAVLAVATFAMGVVLPRAARRAETRARPTAGASDSERD